MTGEHLYQVTDEPTQLRVNQTRDWVRLGAVTGADHWFVFASPSDTPYRTGIQPPEELVARCRDLPIPEAEDGWASKPGAPRR